MWQKRLKEIKKTLPKTTQAVKPSLHNKSTAINQEVDFVSYCQQLDIKPLKQDTKKPPTPQDKLTRHKIKIPTERFEITGEFEFIDTDNSIKEFFRHGQRNLPKELRHEKTYFHKIIDLHYLTKAHSISLLEQLLENAQAGWSIKIIHGIGLNSECNQPILLGTIRKYLSSSPRVLAYSYGAPKQGGNGVTLVKIAR
jgi:DNA-nicking Smr family endonuclease